MSIRECFLQKKRESEHFEYIRECRLSVLFLKSRTREITEIPFCNFSHHTVRDFTKIFPYRQSTCTRECTCKMFTLRVNIFYVHSRVHVNCLFENVLAKSRTTVWCEKLQKEISVISRVLLYTISQGLSCIDSLHSRMYFQNVHSLQSNERVNILEVHSRIDCLYANVLRKPCTVY